MSEKKFINPYDITTRPDYLDDDARIIVHRNIHIDHTDWEDPNSEIKCMDTIVLLYEWDCPNCKILAKTLVIDNAVVYGGGWNKSYKGKKSSGCSDCFNEPQTKGDSDGR